MNDILTIRLAERLKKLRQARGWSLAKLAGESGVSAATLSRLENADVSPTTEMLGKLCSAYALTLSRLLSMVEQGFTPLVCKQEQSLWTDEKSGFIRRSVSPPADQLKAEMLVCELQPGAHITYATPTIPGLEHHLLLQEGELTVEVDGHRHLLKAGDCLRYHLYGASEFQSTCTAGAKYVLVLV